jgi:hypothetical protein
MKRIKNDRRDRRLTEVELSKPTGGRAGKTETPVPVSIDGIDVPSDPPPPTRP